MKTEQISYHQSLIQSLWKCPWNLQTENTFTHIVFVLERNIFSDLEKTDKGWPSEKEALRGTLCPVHPFLGQQGKKTGHLYWLLVEKMMHFCQDSHSWMAFHFVSYDVILIVEYEVIFNCPCNLHNIIFTLSDFFHHKVIWLLSTGLNPKLCHWSLERSELLLPAHSLSSNCKQNPAWSACHLRHSLHTSLQRMGSKTLQQRTSSL